MVNKVGRIKRELNFDSCFCVPCRGRSRGLMLLWNNKTNICINSFSEGHIDAIVKNHLRWWRFTVFYENLVVEKRAKSWKLIERLSGVLNLPWVIGGDFNEILFNEEKEGGGSRESKQVEDFCDTIEKCNLIDLGFIENPFTWSKNKSRENNIKESFD